MNSKTVLAMLIIIGLVFGFITYNKMKDFPDNHTCCKDIKNPDNMQCKVCNGYKWYEKVIYVWRYPKDATGNYPMGVQP